MPRDGHFCVCIKRPLLADLAENRTRPTSYGHIPTYERWKWNGPGTMCSPLRNDSKIKTQWLGILFSNLGGVASASSTPRQVLLPPEKTLGGVIYPLKKNSGSLGGERGSWHKQQPNGGWNATRKHFRRGHIPKKKTFKKKMISKMAAWQPYLMSDWAKIQCYGRRYQYTWSCKARTF